jgi:hypothetical protein
VPEPIAADLRPKNQSFYLRRDFNEFITTKVHFYPLSPTETHYRAKKKPAQVVPEILCFDTMI